jgi:hypothetical protein
MDPKPFTLVLGDYVRFPGVYMLQFYTSFLRDMLPHLVELGLVNSFTTIILPHMSASYAGASFYRVPGVLSLTYVPPSSNPLYVATESVPIEVLGGTSNHDWVHAEVVDAKRPFVQLRMAPWSRPEKAPAPSSVHPMRTRAGRR